MWIKKNVMRNISLILITCLLQSCVARKSVTVPKDQLPSFDQKEIILHLKDVELLLIGHQLLHDHIQGTVTYQIFLSSRSKQIHMYLDSTIEKPNEGQKISIPLTAIEKVEVYDVDVKKTGFTAGGLVIIFGVVIGVSILLLVKEMLSNPFG